ncbi:hypothetical protein HY522_11040 [bacterium]|nr:hypothetical protein [bacterium]
MFKLFLQRNNYAPLRLLLAGILLAGLFLPVDAAHALYISINGRPVNIDSGTAIRSQGLREPISAATHGAGVFNLSFFNEGNSTDTQFALVADSPVSFVAPIYGDTLSLLNGDNLVAIPGDGLYDTVYLTTDTAANGDTLSYVLRLTSHANTLDTLGLIVDTIWLSGSVTAGDTSGRFSYQFFDSAGETLTAVLTRTHQGTGLVPLSANHSGTATIRIYTTGTVDADTIRVAVRAYANNGSGRIPGSSREVAAYRGFNGIKYGGNGNDATHIDVTVSGPLIYVAKADTVFAPVSLGGATGVDAADTQRYVPGALVVSTIWFDNDGTDTSDTITIEDWIDTRHVRFDSAGLSAIVGVAGQIAASGTHVLSGYGNIFTDSAMPTFAAGFGVTIQYVNGAGVWANLTAATPLEAVARLRWTIFRAGGVVGAHNGDAMGTVDAAPLAPTASGDADMGFVRYSVVIR